MSVNIWHVDEEAINTKMLKEFNKTKDDLNEYINIMSEWAKTQPHFPEKPRVRLLRFFILLNKFSIERVKQKLDMYYTIRSLIPEFFKYTPLSTEMRLQSRIVYCVPLPQVTPGTSRIIYCRFNPNYGPDYFVPDQVAAYFVNLVELFMEKDKCFTFIHVYDFIGVQLGHLPKFTPMFFKKIANVIEKVYSNRIESIYFVNFPKYMDTILNVILKPALNPKLRERITVHSNTNILLEVFEKSRMPKDIGGEERSLDELADLTLKSFEEEKERYEVLGKLRVDASLRPVKLVNDEVLGYYGNFKNVNVD